MSEAPGTEQTQITAAEVGRWVRAFAAAVTEAKDELTRLDSAIGDADHGINMDRGMTAVVAALDASEPDEIPALMRSVGMTLISKVGGAGGPLYGTFFLQFGSGARDGAALSPEGWANCLDAAVAGVKSRGKAEPGDKTMLDALLPAAEALRRRPRGGRGLRGGAGPGGRRRRAGCPRHDSARRPQGPRELPG